MTEPQPPAGWYPDPQNAAQQRYWDGTTWTGHTAAAAATVSSPTGDAPAGAALPTGAPAWTMQPGAMPVAAKKSWYKRKWFLIPAAVVIVLVVLGVAFGSGGDASNAMEKSIKSDGQAQLQKAYSADHPGGIVKVVTVNCVETGDSQEYNCQIHGTLAYQGDTEKFLENAAGSCDNKASCLWHTTDAPHPDNS